MVLLYSGQYTEAIPYCTGILSNSEATVALQQKGFIVMLRSFYNLGNPSAAKDLISKLQLDKEDTLVLSTDLVINSLPSLSKLVTADFMYEVAVECKYR